MTKELAKKKKAIGREYSIEARSQRHLNDEEKIRDEDTKRNAKNTVVKNK